MAKTGGLGDNLYVGGFDLSGDINSISNIGGGVNPLPVTGINRSAMERIGGERDGRVDFVAYFNTAVGAAHLRLSPLPTTDQIITYCRGTNLGDEAACLIGKQINYDPTLAQDGTFTFAVNAQASTAGLEWGNQLTAGLRTDTAATNGTGYDTAASLSFGAQAYLQVTALTGTDATVKIQDSADNITFADVAGLTFTQVTAAPATQRLATVNTATIRRYVRASTVTTGGFTVLTFSLVVNKNPIAGVIF